MAACAALTVTLALTPATQAQIVTSSWSSAVSGSWDDGSKWDKGSPLAGTNAYLGGNGSYAVDFTNPVNYAIGALIITILGMLAYGTAVPSSPAAVGLAYVVGVFCFSAIGVLLASLAPTARAAQSVGLLLWFIMLFVSGTSAPLDRLPSWMLDIGKALPLYHVVLTLVDPWIGRGSNWAQLGIVAAIGAVATLVSLRLFRWE